MTGLRFSPVNYAPLNLRDYGAKLDGTTDDTAALTAAIATLGSTARRRIALPPTPTGKAKITSTIQVNTRGLVIEGERGERPDQAGGSQLLYSGTGPLFQIGTDDGLAHDRAGYDGVQGFTLANVALKHSGAATALNNGQGNYKSGAYAIRDWRGGDIVLDRCLIENFEYGFWGIQSDINWFEKLNVRYCKVGVYLGPRSDQATIQAMYTLHNDTALWMDKVTLARIRDAQFVGDGSSTDAPVKIGSAWSVGSDGITFDNCWFEHFQGASVIGPFVSIGVGDSVTSRNIFFRNTQIQTNNQVTTLRATSFLKIEAADKIVVEGMSGLPENLAQLIEFVGSTSPTVRITASNTPSQNTTTTNSGTGSPKVHKEIWTSAQRQFDGPLTRFTSSSPGTEQVTLGTTSDAGKISFRRGSDGSAAGFVGYPSATEASEFQIRAGGGGGFVSWYTNTTEKMRLTNAGKLGIGTTGPVSTAHIYGSLSLKSVITAVDLTLDDTHCVVLTNGTVTVTLPLVASTEGRTYIIKNVHATNTTTIAASGSDLIDGSASYSLSTQYQFVVLVNASNRWAVVGKG